jgi:hypothetical protein
MLGRVVLALPGYHDTGADDGAGVLRLKYLGAAGWAAAFWLQILRALESTRPFNIRLLPAAG